MCGRPARASRRALSQCFLRSDEVAAQLVREAQIGPGDLVLEIGAGSGTLTEQLAAHAGHVVAVECDGRWATRLRERFGDQGVEVVETDALRLPLPGRPFKVVSNLPFHLSSQFLRKLLDDPGRPLERAELIVGWGFAIGRASVHPPRLASISWQPWFELVVTRRLPARLFTPAPAADAAVMSIRRRPFPLIAPEERAPFLRLVRRGYAAGGPLGRSLRSWMDGQQWKRLATSLGFTASAPAAELDVWQWAALFRFVEGQRPAPYLPPPAAGGGREGGHLATPVSLSPGAAGGGLPRRPSPGRGAGRPGDGRGRTR